MCLGPGHMGGDTLFCIILLQKQKKRAAHVPPASYEGGYHEMSNHSEVTGVSLWVCLSKQAIRKWKLGKPSEEVLPDIYYYARCKSQSK